MTPSDKEFFFMQQRIAQGQEARDAHMFFLVRQAIQREIDARELALDSEIWTDEARQRLKNERDLLQESMFRFTLR